MSNETEELFPAEVGQMDSPRLAWMKRHNVIIWCSGERHYLSEWDRWYAGIAPGVAGVKAVAQWFCDECGRNGDMTVGMGATEEDALLNLAEKHDLRLWNEETL